jgi:GNAT superfamily N-acetyltransferase
MPYEYFDRYVFECWAAYGHPGVLRQYKLKNLDDEGRVRWYAHDEDDHHIYAFEVRNPQGDERRAWTFVIERDGALEVEELYVRPEYRRLGHGRWLSDRVAQLAREKGIPLRLWVGFADCKAESESNSPALVAIARRLGVQFQPCPVPWAAYFGTTEQPGEVLPIEPKAVPDRPRAPRDAVRAFVRATLGLGLGDPRAGVTPPAAPQQVEARADVIDVLQRIHAEQAASGYLPRSREQIDADIAAMRQEDEERMQQIERLHEECQRTHQPQPPAATP